VRTAVIFEKYLWFSFNQNFSAEFIFHDSPSVDINHPSKLNVISFLLLLLWLALWRDRAWHFEETKVALWGDESGTLGRQGWHFGETNGKNFSC
jgi:hypothetical protein